MSDRIELRGISARGFHGVLPEERRDGQPFVVDVAIELDVTAAATSDHLDRTVDYSALAAVVVAVVTGDPVQLIERLAHLVAEQCLAFDERIEAVEIAVHKPEAPVGTPVDDVVVTIRRTRA